MYVWSHICPRKEHLKSKTPPKICCNSKFILFIYLSKRSNLKYKHFNLKPKRIDNLKPSNKKLIIRRLIRRKETIRILFISFSVFYLFFSSSSGSSSDILSSLRINIPNMVRTAKLNPTGIADARIHA